MDDLTGVGSAGPVVLGDRYELLELLGRGGMADVFQALDRRTGRTVAVKLFRPGIDLMESDRRLRREVELLESLQHPGLVRVLDADVGDDAIAGQRAYVVMELIDGPTLADRIRREPLEPAQAAALGAALCSALAYVHERGVVHRDVKPANVLLTRSGHTDVITPKLTDFGIAQVVDSTRLTTDGLTVGTANYLSPEQVRGSRVDPASDVYSLGLVLLEAVTGEVAYPGHGVEAAVARLHRPPVLPPDLPPRLGAVLARMTARDPQHRATALAVGAELQLVADPSLVSELLAFDGSGAPATRPDDELTTLITAGQHRRAAGRRRSGLLTAAAASVGVLALLGAYLGKGNPVSDGSPSLGSTPSSSSPHTPGASASVSRSVTAVSRSSGTSERVAASTHPASHSVVHSVVHSAAPLGASSSRTTRTTAVHPAPVPQKKSKPPKKTKPVKHKPTKPPKH